jgi:NAD(P)H-flavin reductase
MPTSTNAFHYGSLERSPGRNAVVAGVLKPDPTHSQDPWMSHPARLKRLVHETAGVTTYELVLEDAQEARNYRFLPGQFNMIYVPGVGEAAISMSGSHRDPSRITHTIRAAGNVTNALARQKRGGSVGLRGPFGSSWPIDICQGKDLILVGGGIGLAPLRPVIYEVMQNRGSYGRVTIIHGARRSSSLLFAKQYRAWEKSGIAVEPTVDRAEPDWSGHVGVVTLLLDRLEIQRPESTVLLTCGPEVMMHFACKSALARSIPPSNIWLSMERHMNCAIGLCGHCLFGSAFVCREGPVFRYDRIAELMRVQGL